MVEQDEKHPRNSESRLSPGKIAAGIVGCVFAIALILLALAPVIMNTDWGRQKVLAQVNASLSGKVTVRTMQFSWFNGQWAQEVVVEDPNGIPVLTIDRVSTDLTPLGLVFASEDLGHVSLEGLRADLEQKSAGRTNLHEALFLAPLAKTKNSSKTTSSETFGPSLGFPYRGTFTLQDASVTLRSNGETPVTFDQVNGALRSSVNEDAVTLKLKGLSHKQGLEGDFAIDCSLTGFGPDGRINFSRGSSGVPLPEGMGEVRLKLDMEQVAVGIFDQLITFQTPRLTGLLADGLGETLTTHVDALVNRRGIELEIEASSPNLQATLDTKMHNGRLVLSSPGRVGLRITPDFFQHIAPVNSQGVPVLTLLQDTEVELVLERMSLPTVLADKNTAPPTMRLRLRVDQADLIDPAGLLGVVRTQGLTGAIERLEATQAYLMNLEGEVSHNDKLASVRFAGKIQDQEEEDAPLQGDFNLTAKDISTVLVDHIMQWQNLLSETVGDNVDVDVKASLEENDLFLTVRGGSDLLSIPALELETQAGRVVLREPAQVHFQITPAFVRQLGGNDETTVSLVHETPMLVSIDSFTCPLPALLGGQHSLNPANINLEAEAVVAPFEVNNFGSPGARARFSNSTLAFKGDPIGEARFDITLDVASDGASPLITALLGSISTVQLEGRLRQQPDDSVVLGDTRLSLQNELVDFRMVGHVDNEGRLVLNSPATLRYSLKPDVLLGLGLIRPDSPQLAHKTPLELRIETLAVNLDDLPSGRLLMGGKGLLHNLSVVDERHKPLAFVREMQLQWEYNGNERIASLGLNATTQASNSEQLGSMQLALQAQGWHVEAPWNTEGTSIHLQGKTEDLPTVLLAALSGQGDLPILTGPTLSSEFTANIGPDKNGKNAVSFQIKGQDLAAKGEANLATAQSFLEQTKEWRLDWTITPERQAVLQRRGWVSEQLPWQLAAEGQLSLSLTQFSLLRNPVSLSDSQQTPWYTAAVTGTLDTKNLQLRDKNSGKESSLDSLSIAFQTEDIRDDVNFSFSSQSLPAANHPPAKLTADGRLQNLYRNGSWAAKDTVAVSVDMQGEHVALEELLHYPLRTITAAQHIPSLIGEQVSGRMHIDIAAGQGALSAALTGTSGSFTLDGSIQDNVLLLNEPVELSLEITPQIRDGLLRDIAPFMASAVSSDKQITLHVAPEGFALPLNATDPRQIQIPHAALDLGHVEFTQASALGTVVRMLNKEKSDQATFSVWFTPLHISLQQGLVRISRMDALVADTYPIALWGKIDLVKDRVRMVIGITAQALQEAYGISNLGDDYMLQIPFKGTTASADIDRGKATARITSLVAQSQGSPEGIVIGGVLDLIGGMDDGRVPPPTTPVPWKTAQSSNDKKQLKQQIQTEMKKGVKKLLDIFNP